MCDWFKKWIKIVAMVVNVETLLHVVAKTTFNSRHDKNDAIWTIIGTSYGRHVQKRQGTKDHIREKNCWHSVHVLHRSQILWVRETRYELFSTESMLLYCTECSIDLSYDYVIMKAKYSYQYIDTNMGVMLGIKV